MTTHYYLPGYFKSGTLRLIFPYMGEAFDDFEDAVRYVAEEELDKYHDIAIYEITRSRL
jgi:hypothetical protein